MYADINCRLRLHPTTGKDCFFDTLEDLEKILVNSSAGRSPSRCLKRYRYQSSLSGSQFLRFIGASCGLTPLAPCTVLSSAEIEAEGEQ